MKLAGAIGLGLVAIVVGGTILLRIFIALNQGSQERTFGEPMDFATLQLLSKPNQYLLAPAGATAAQPHGEPPTFPVPPDRLVSGLEKIVAATPRTRILQRSPDGLGFTAVQTTALMAFPDFIAVEARPVDGGSTLLVYSRSVYGIRDFGVNKARVEGWLAALKQELKQEAGAG